MDDWGGLGGASAACECSAVAAASACHVSTDCPFALVSARRCYVAGRDRPFRPGRGTVVSPRSGAASGTVLPLRTERSGRSRWEYACQRATVGCWSLRTLSEGISCVGRGRALTSRALAPRNTGGVVGNPIRRGFSVNGTTAGHRRTRFASGRRLNCPGDCPRPLSRSPPRVNPSHMPRSDRRALTIWLCRGVIRNLGNLTMLRTGSPARSPSPHT